MSTTRLLAEAVTSGIKQAQYRVHELMSEAIALARSGGNTELADQLTRLLPLAKGTGPEATAMRFLAALASKTDTRGWDYEQIEDADDYDFGEHVDGATWWAARRSNVGRSELSHVIFMTLNDKVQVAVAGSDRADGFGGTEFTDIETALEPIVLAFTRI